MAIKGFILVISSLGIAQALFISLYLFTVKKGNRIANRLLAFLLLALTIRIGKSIFHNYIQVDPEIRNLGISTILAAGPLLWLYGKTLLSKHYSFKKQHYIHFVPFLVFAICSPIIPNNGDTLSLLLYFLVFLHFGIYIGISWKRIRQIKNQMSPKLLKWYRNIVIGNTSIWGLYLAIFFGWIPFYILGAIAFSFLMYIFSFLLLQKHVFMLEKYGNSSIDPVTSRTLHTQVKTLFEDETVYTDSRVSLQTIAEQLKVTPRILSQVINENENKNFSEFVNHYRIEKSKKLLRDPHYQNEKIATIAYDCGFGNVTSFNLAFKSATQTTPSAFRKQFAAS